MWWVMEPGDRAEGAMEPGAEVWLMMEPGTDGVYVKRWRENNCSERSKNLAKLGATAIVQG